MQESVRWEFPDWLVAARTLYAGSPQNRAFECRTTVQDVRSLYHRLGYLMGYPLLRSVLLTQDPRAEGDRTAPTAYSSP